MLLEAKLRGESLQPLLKYDSVQVRVHSKNYTLSKNDIIKLMQCDLCRQRMINEITTTEIPDVKKIIIDFLNKNFVVVQKRHLRRRVFKKMLTKHLSSLNIHLSKELYKWTIQYIDSTSTQYRCLKIKSADKVHI